MSVHPFICLSIHPSIHLSIYTTILYHQAKITKKNIYILFCFFVLFCLNYQSCSTIIRACASLVDCCLNLSHLLYWCRETGTNQALMRHSQAQEKYKSGTGEAHQVQVIYKHRHIGYRSPIQVQVRCTVVQSSRCKVSGVWRFAPLLQYQNFQFFS